MTGLPTSISRICDTIKVMLLNNMLVVTAGAAAVTALSVRTQAYSFLGALAIGIGTAAIPVVGMFFGEEDRTSLKAALRTSLCYGLALNGLLAVVLLIHPAFFSEMLGIADPVTMEMANEALRYFAIGIPIALVNTVLMNFYQSTKKTGFATAICVMQGLIYTVLFAFILINPLGSTGVWAAFLLGEIFTLISIVIVTTYRNRRFSIKPEDYMMLGQEFGRNRDIDRESLNRISLFIEEMAGNIVKHAFQPGEKKRFDLMLLDKPDSIVIRLRDNGAAFDPLNDAAQRDDPEDLRYSLRLVTSLSDRLEYRRSLGLNVVIMEIRKGS